MALATFAVNAQNKNSERKENRKEMKANLTPEQRADLKTKKMTLALDLTASQQQKVKQLILKAENEKPERPENWKEMTDTQKYETKSAMLDRRIAMKKELKEILTEEQMTKWEVQQSHRRAGVKAKRNHGRNAKQ
jgi:Spy/CpxP family protein refolding chaperone